MLHLSTGISHTSYQLGDHTQSLAQLAKSKLLDSTPEVLGDFGFEHCHVFSSEEAFRSALLECGRAALATAGIPPEQVDVLVLYTGLITPPKKTTTVLSLFNYPLGSIQHTLNLKNAYPVALSQRGCSGLFSGLHIANQLLPNNGGVALCLTGEMLPSKAKREIILNVISDAAGALILQRTATVKNRVIAIHEYTLPYYHDTVGSEQEILAAYFPASQRAIEQCLNEARLKMSDITHIVPHNVSRRSWQILAGVLGVSEEKVWLDNVGKVGHTISCDPIINLQGMERAGVLRTGDKLLLFTFGFGASWSVMIIEH